MTTAALLLVGVLIVFSARRLLWVIASWLPRRASHVAEPGPQVLIGIAFRNEQDSLPHLLSCLDAIEYDPARLSICLVDDASTDASPALAAAWARNRGNATLVALDANVGKAEALNRALAIASTDVEVLVVYDADQRPAPQSLRRLVAPFADPRADAACGYRRPTAEKANAVAAYGCLEAWTQQLVNLAAKDALRLDPPTMGGNCAYRRSALERIGGFPAGALSEDIEVSLALAAAGGTTRFLRDAVADHAVADSFRHFVSQRLRWSQGMRAARRRVRGPEAAFVVAGYLDRVVMLLVIGCAAGGLVAPWWLAAYAIPVLAAAGTALVKARPAPRLALRVILLSPPMFVFDVVVSLLATLYGIARRRVSWVDRRSAGSSMAGAHAGRDLADEAQKQGTA